LRIKKRLFAHTQRDAVKQYSACLSTASLCRTHWTDLKGIDAILDFVVGY
jgi:hypothetical protein